MKTVRWFSWMFFFALFTGCTIDPIEGENTYSVVNTTDQPIQVAYTYTDEVNWLEMKEGAPVRIEPKQTKQFLMFHGGLPDWTPNYVFENVVFLSETNDTLFILEPVNDDEWLLTDSIKDYGYVVGYYHWTYKFAH